VTICLDGWTAKSLASTYVGISACFFDQASYKPIHATLNLCRLPHTHAAIAISDALEKCLQELKISPNIVMLIISDNGANVIKAIKLMQERAERQKQLEEEESVSAVMAGE